MALPLALDLVLDVQEKHTHRVRSFGYGDGYEQIEPDGINTHSREYNITTIPFSQSTYISFKRNLDQVCVGETFLVESLEPFIPRASAEAGHFRLVDNTYSVSYLPASDKYRFTFVLKEAFVS
jgi:hypothetical protein|tara:strand:- start:96 stop:464 length:369 start_codon:yes stop_codon:yes gene_type:complete